MEKQNSLYKIIKRILRCLINETSEMVREKFSSEKREKRNLRQTQIFFNFIY